MKLRAYAKINLILDIWGKRADGYHLLSMIMQSIGLHDVLTLTKSGQITVKSNDTQLPCNENNTALTAAKLFFENAEFDGGVEITIDKHIPVAAGLGGGSADAAAVLVGLNELYQRPFTLPDLCELALNVGADVPFCITGGTASVEGIGEKIMALPAMPACGIVLVKPCEKPSTGEMYKAADGCKFLHHPDYHKAAQALEKQDLSGLCDALGNSFDSVWQEERLIQAKKDLKSLGALGVSLSGSGPTVFGIFENVEAAQVAAKQLSELYEKVFATYPKNIGTEII